MRNRRSQLQSQVVVHRDLNILLRPQIAFGRLDGGVPQQELDLLEIPAVLPAERLLIGFWPQLNFDMRVR